MKAQNLIIMLSIFQVLKSHIKRWVAKQTQIGIPVHFNNSEEKRGEGDEV